MQISTFDTKVDSYKKINKHVLASALLHQASKVGTSITNAKRAYECKMGN